MFEPIYYTAVPEDALFIDVRSPSEYAHATIEGAINIPIFSDEERALIGTMYKQDSTDHAKIKGVEIVSQKLPAIFKQVIDLKRNAKRPLVFFCARGGYRSKSIAMFLNSMGEQVFLLKGGYKAYRSYVLSELDKLTQEKNFIVLHGNTGIGKTRLLKALKKQGLDILDLEEGANHRGSILGGVGLGEGSSLKAFESYIYHRLNESDAPYIFVEAESRRIGRVFIPIPLHEKMQEGLHINLTANYDFRAEILIDDYTNHVSFEEDMEKAIRYLGKYVGEQKVNDYLKLVAKKDFKPLAVELMKNYYDPMYEHKANKINYEFEHHIQSIDETVQVIREWYEMIVNPL